MGQLEDMHVFLRVVETGGITKAAEQMNIAKSAVSKRLASLEHKLGIKLNIAVPLSFGLSHLAPALDLFLKEHADLKLKINFSDQRIDIIEQGVDLAFRIGQLDNSSMQARKIAPIKHVLCASPEYLKLHGEPKSPDDLKRHKILKYGSPDRNSLKFLTQDGKEQVVYLEPHFIANNGDFLKSLADPVIGFS